MKNEKQKIDVLHVVAIVGNLAYYTGATNPQQIEVVHLMLIVPLMYFGELIFKTKAFYCLVVSIAFVPRIFFGTILCPYTLVAECYKNEHSPDKVWFTITFSIVVSWVISRIMFGKTETQKPSS